MRRRFFIMILILALLVGPVHGAEDYIKWVDFNVSYGFGSGYPVPGAGYACELD